VAKRLGELGMLLLGIWLLLQGLVPLLRVHFIALGTIMQLLAVGAGILILLRR
jgi:hypothetical protein